jgi:enterochelin esterase-like enzyme
MQGLLTFAIALTVSSPVSEPLEGTVDRINAQHRQPVEWVTREVKAPRISFHTFQSGAAKCKVSYHVYTPASYTTEPERKFPVVYWLHGSGGGLAGLPQVAQHFDEAISTGKLPPCLVVFVNGMVNGMYVDWKDGSVPMESVIMKDLIPHVDSSFRTLANRDGRMLDGFSMGGYGSARLGFKYPNTFRAVSIVGAGPMQKDLLDAPRAGKARATQVLDRVYGGDKDYFYAVSPLKLAEKNASKLMKNSMIRVVIGSADETLPANEAFHEHLKMLKIPHAWTVLPGVGHDPMAVLKALGEDNWAFYRSAFGSGSKAGNRL